MSSRILGANRGLEWHRAVAPGGEVGEITTHGLALSRPRRGFESRWGHQLDGLLRMKAEEEALSLPVRGHGDLPRALVHLGPCDQTGFRILTCHDGSNSDAER